MFKKLIISLVTLAVLVSISATDYFFLDDEVFDARSASIGNTSLLSTRGSNALFTNPGLLIDYDNLDLKVTGRGRYHNTEDKGYYNDKEIVETDMCFGSLALSKSITTDFSKIAFGLGVNRLKNFKYETVDGYKEKGALNMLALGIGIDYKGVLDIGLAYNKSFASDTEMFASSDMADIEAEYLLYSINVNIENITLALSYKDKYELKPEENLQEWGGVEFPAELKLGLSVDVDSRLSLYGEVMQKKMSDYRWLEGGFKPFKAYDDIYDIGFGMEYSTYYDLRLGIFRKAVERFSNADEEFLYHYGYTLGYGAELIDNFTLDLYFQNSFLSDDVVLDTHDDSGENYEEKVELDNLYINFGLTLGYQFDM